MIQRMFLLAITLSMVKGDFRTSPSWKIDFPEFPNIFKTVTFRVLFHPETNLYQADTSLGTSPLVIRHLSTVNLALANFTPSEPEIFAQFPYGALTVRETTTKPGLPQSTFPAMHNDEHIGGFVKDGIFYDGQFFGNSVPNSCALFIPATDSSKATEKFLEPFQLYWIDENAPHRAIGFRESVQRQYVSIGLGYYLTAFTRRQFLKLRS
jgi:hypothetical protein